MDRHSGRLLASVFSLVLLLACAAPLHAQGGNINNGGGEPTAPELDPGLTASGIALVIGAAAWLSSARKR